MLNKKQTNSDRNCVTTYTSCIKYDGFDLPFLGIKNGDNMNAILCAISDKISEVSEAQDVKDINTSCLPTTPATPKTLLSYLQLIINKECTP